MKPMHLVVTCAAWASLAGCGGNGGHNGAANVVPPFAAPSAYSVGAARTPSAVVTTDLSADGRLDVAAANRTTSSVTVFLGTGSGGLGAGIEFPLGIGTGPSALVAADFNRDGNPDLAVACATSDSVVILTNSGLGTFGVTFNVPFTAGAAPSGIVYADFNQDGKLDLAVSAKGTDDLQVALGNGDGTFAAATAYPLGAGFAATGLAVADFNTDGDLDLVASGSANGDVAVLLGLGTGVFGPAVVTVLAAGADLSAVLAADVNGDGDADVVAANRTAGTVAVLLGVGNGTFSPVTSSPVGADVASIVAADFDRDGKLDVAGALEASSRVRLLLGHADGTFAAATDLSSGGTGPVSLAVGDLDGNGSLDLVVANSASDDVAVLLGVSHTIPNNLSLSGTVNSGATFQPNDVVRADFNGDGRLDLAIANRNHDSFSVALGAVGGTFSPAVETTIALSSMPVALVAADFDDDGQVDLAVLTYTTHSVVLRKGTGTGTFTGAGTILLPLGSAPVALVAADFDRDGRLDLAITNSLLGTVSFAQGNGDMTFNAPVSYLLPAGFQGSAMTVTDLNDDGKLDLAVTGATTGDVAILLGDGLGAFAAATSVLVASGANLTSVWASDVDRDGDVDLVTVNNTAGQVSVLLGNGDGTFGAPAATSVGADATAVVGGDFNRDGRIDLAVTLAGTGQVAILSGNGAGLFTPVLTASTGGNGAVALVTGDWNGDGRLDLAVANQIAGNVGIVRGN